MCHLRSIFQFQYRQQKIIIATTTSTAVVALNRDGFISMTVDKFGSVFSKWSSQPSKHEILNNILFLAIGYWLEKCVTQYLVMLLKERLDEQTI